jgi:uncharacterized GH25 family protein
MIRFPLAALAVASMTLAAHAHFVFVIPDKDGAAVRVVFSDDLDPDEGVEIAKVAGLKLTCRDAGGKDTPVTLKAGKHEMTTALPGTGPRVVFGSVEYGVLQKGDAKPYRLVYHPKAVVGWAGEKAATLGAGCPAELVPVADGGRVRFRLLAAGKPVAAAEVTVLHPDGSRARLKTDQDGLTPSVEGPGRYGAWARYFETKAGEQAGKKYEEVRHYATVVVDVAK